MASLLSIRDAIKTTLEANVSGLRVYDTIPDEPAELPCVVVEPASSDFFVAMGRGTDTWRFNLYVLTDRQHATQSQDSLDAFISGAGVNSIRQAIFANKTLGIADDVNANVDAVTAYAGQGYEAAGYAHIGATLSLVVTTKGTA